MAAKRQTKAAMEAERRARFEERMENIIAILIVALICSAAVWWVYDKMHPDPVSVDEERTMMVYGGAPTMGAPDAPVTVAIFSDFECSYCGVFARDDLPAIEQRYVDTGEARIVYFTFPLARTHPSAVQAASASLCAEAQGKFWEYHDLLYAHQDALSRDDLVGYAAGLGLDEDLFADCVDQGQFLPAVDRMAAYGQQIGVTGTPTMFFNGRRVVGALSPEEFGKEMAAELAFAASTK